MLGDEHSAALLARTDEMCARDPRAARVRMLLLRLEKQMHRQGWGGPDADPRIFSVSYNVNGSAVNHQWWPLYTAILSHLTALNDGDSAAALGQLVTYIEDSQRGVYDDVLRRAGVPAELIQRAKRRPGCDLFTTPGSGSGWRFYGFGLRFEAWVLSPSDDREAAHYAALGAIHRHPRRGESREVWFCARDGWLWRVMRLRGAPPVCLALMPEGDWTASGVVPNGLSRLTNVATSNPVPVWPADDVDGTFVYVDPGAR